MKNTPVPTIQLSMNFNSTGENRFKSLLDGAVFNLMLEVKLPAADADLDSAAARLKPFRDIAAASQIPCGLAFLDDSTAYPTLNPCAFASALCPDSRDSHLIYVSGNSGSHESIEGLLAQCRLDGFKNIVAVSGKPAQKPSHPLESTRILAINTLGKDPLFAGCTVNPFKYNITGTMAQYFKLVRKINCGASFIVSQFGWDAKKIQELAWQLDRRSLTQPMLARALMLTPDDVESICAGKIPGIRFSVDFRNALKREMQHSTIQFEAAQWRRLQLHAAGVRFLGCTGLQIGGLTRPEQAEMALKLITESLNELKTFDDWLDAYSDYYSRMDMAPYPHRFYLFDNLLARDADSAHAKNSRRRVPQPSTGEKFRFRLSRFLFGKSSGTGTAEHRLSKRILASCRGCGHCRLDRCAYVCPEHCPRGFADGVCGEPDEAGNCPFNAQECVFARRVRLGLHTQDFYSLEGSPVAAETDLK